MNPRRNSAVLCALALAACTRATVTPNDGGSRAGAAASAADSGAGATSGGHGGQNAAGAGGDCRNVAIPQLCRLCADGSCGVPTCAGGTFTGFVCPNGDGGAGAAGSGAAGGGGGACNLLCVQGKHCVANPKPSCVDDDMDAGALDAGAMQSCGGFAGTLCPGAGECVDVPNDGCDPKSNGADCAGMCVCPGPTPCPQGFTFDDSPSKCACVNASSGGLHWFASCGFPVCSTNDQDPYDDPNIPNCTTEKVSQTCATQDQRCDGVLSCGQTLICAQEAPRTCPISRAAFKRDIRYLDDAQRARIHDQITQLRLASYRYESAPDVPQLGFMIDDVEPSPVASGDHVNLYAYLSMAVAAIQVQDERIHGLERELEVLRAEHRGGAPVCEAAAPDRASNRAVSLQSDHSLDR